MAQGSERREGQRHPDSRTEPDAAGNDGYDEGVGQRRDHVRVRRLEPGVGGDLHQVAAAAVRVA